MSPKELKEKAVKEWPVFLIRAMTPLFSFLALFMLNTVVTKLNDFESIQQKHLIEYASHVMYANTTLNAVIHNQKKIISRQDYIYGEQKQRGPIVYGFSSMIKQRKLLGNEYYEPEIESESSN